MRLITGLFRLMFRLVLLPIKLILATFGVSFRVGYRVGTAPVRVGARATRAAGISGVLCFILGVAVGLLFAPGPGRELRERAMRMIAGGGALTDGELSEKVSFELGHAPRTWHLPQPEVAVVAGQVQLRGGVPHETAREELVKVAAAVPGVHGVDDLLEIEEPVSTDGE